ncbi:MAG: hypothetical protein JWN95_2318 [Frankiales bacterium]|nr:hypothetical protein [Frankiales bacterium]
MRLSRLVAPFVAILLTVSAVSLTSAQQAGAATARPSAAAQAASAHAKAVAAAKARAHAAAVAKARAVAAAKAKAAAAAKAKAAAAAKAKASAAAKAKAAAAAKVKTAAAAKAKATADAKAKAAAAAKAKAAADAAAAAKAKAAATAAAAAKAKAAADAAAAAKAKAAAAAAAATAAADAKAAADAAAAKAKADAAAAAAAAAAQSAAARAVAQAAAAAEAVQAATAATAAAQTATNAATTQAESATAVGAYPSITPGSALLSVLNTTANGLIGQSSATDPYYFASPEWYTGTDVCFRCTTGPALTAAVTAALSGDAGQLAVVEAYFDNVVANHQAANGSFGPYPVAEGGPDIATTTIANALGEAWFVLGDRLDATRKAAWATGITRAADFLVANKNLAWYTNGNIVLANMLTMALAYKVSGDPKYQTLTQQALDFALSPPQARWPGYGLVYTTVPTQADGSDGAGFLTESGAGGLGYDADYTQAQVDVTSWWYLVTGDPTALRLTNLLVNTLLPRVNKTTWALNTSGGSRHTTENRYIGFTTSALMVLATKGGRTDLVPYVASQSATQQSFFRSGLTFANPTLSFYYGSQYAPSLWAMGTS